MMTRSNQVFQLSTGQVARRVTNPSTTERFYGWQDEWETWYTFCPEDGAWIMAQCHKEESATLVGRNGRMARLLSSVRAMLQAGEVDDKFAAVVHAAIKG
jgi:predicted RNA-binding protein YlqC (UPF0109 family)